MLDYCNQSPTLREQFTQYNLAKRMDRENDEGDQVAKEIYAGARVEISLRIAHVMSSVYKQITNNPDTNVKAIAEIIHEESSGLPNMQILHKFGRSMLDKIAQKRANLDNLISSSEMKLSSPIESDWTDDDRGLLAQAIFTQYTGSFPTGQVAYISTPFALGIHCYSSSDYATLVKESALASSGGIFIKGSNENTPNKPQENPDLIAMRQQEGLEHEVGHSLISIAKDVLQSEVSVSRRDIFPIPLARVYELVDSSSENKLSPIGKKWFGVLAQDELIADYFESGNFSHVRALKNDPIYDYIALSWPHSQEYPELVERINNAYHKFMDDSVYWAKYIMNHCNEYSSRYNLTPWILLQYPMSQWETIGRYFKLENDSHEDSNIVRMGIINTLSSIDKARSSVGDKPIFGGEIKSLLTKEQVKWNDLNNIGLGSHVAIGHANRKDAKSQLTLIKRRLAEVWGQIPHEKVTWSNLVLSPETLAEEGYLNPSN